MNTAMTPHFRKPGVDVVGDLPWGTHFCVFYDTKADLLETLVAYCRAGLQNDEFCLWVVAAPLTVDDATKALRQGIPDFDRYLLDSSIEIVAARNWYLLDGKFELTRVVDGWNEKLSRALAKGYAGVRVAGDTAWLEENDWSDFCEYEEKLNQTIANQRLTVMCTYPIDACGAADILDVVQTHEFAITKRRGGWEVIETAGHRQARTEIRRLSDDATERRRTDEEREKARQAQADLAHVTRVTAMGELTASLAHEIKQPIAAAMIDAQTCLRWLGRESPDVAEAREAASAILKDVTRASEIINRIRLLFQRGDPERQLLDVNEVIHEMIGLLRGETSRYAISVRRELAHDLPKVMADRVQVQQVLMNLMVNAIEAMKDTGIGGELTVASRRNEDREVEVSVSDTGLGLQPERVEQVFQAFFTTKPQGTGMGLSLSRSIIESHGGRLWAGAGARQGATFQFTLPFESAPREAALA